MSAQHRRAFYRSPPTPPDEGDHAHHAPVIVDFFKPSITLTPPASLPTSPPDSPPRSLKKAKVRPRTPNAEGPPGRSGGAQLGATGATEAIKTKGSPTKRVKVAGKELGSLRKRGETVLRVDIPGSEDASLPQSYRVEPTSPILPKVKLAFPTIMSDEEEDDWGQSRARTSFSILPQPDGTSEVASEGMSTSSPNRGGHRRTWSQTTKTTKTERRSWRYSLPSAPPSSFDQDRPDSPSPPSVATATSSPRSEAKHTNPSKTLPRRSHSLREHETPRRTVPPLASSPSTVQASTRGSRPSTPTKRTKRPTSLGIPPASSSFASGSPPAIPTYPTSTANTFASHIPPPHDDATPAIVSPPPNPALSLVIFQPFMNIFLFFSLASLFFTSISVFLLFGLTLTFYDDCEKKLAIVWRGMEEGQKRIKGGVEGVREGIGRMLGGARGALEIVVVGAKRIHLSSATSTAGAKDLPLGVGLGVGGVGGFWDGDGLSESVGMNKGRSYSRGRSRTRRRKSSSRARPPQVEQHPGKVGQPPFSPRHTDDWISDEDALPFDVPNSTPHASRTNSPHRRSPSPSPHSYSHTTSNTTSKGHPTLPPRPPLIYLFPSILLALLYTIWKIARGLWKIGGKIS